MSLCYQCAGLGYYTDSLYPEGRRPCSCRACAFTESLRSQTDAALEQMGMRIAGQLYAVKQYQDWLAGLPWWKRLFILKLKVPVRRAYWRVRDFSRGGDDE